MATLRAFIAPSEDWRVRVFAAFISIVLDYAMTGIFCKEFTDEANTLLRTFMIHFDSVPIGVIVFALSFYGPVYVLLCYLTNRDWAGLKKISLFELLSEHRRPLFDIAFGLGVASWHFEGAMSWVLPLSNRLWLALGLMFYLSLVHMGTLLVNLRGLG